MTQLEQIRVRTEASLSEHVPARSRVALLDFPNHTNAGDSLIYLGEMAYFKHLDIEIAYMSDKRSFNGRELDRRIGDGTILLHGGGNVGDRWTRSQAFREDVISRWPHRRIIQLPQSIDFNDPSALVRAQRVFGAHPHLTLMLRDHRSLAFAREHFASNTIEFCPDLALGMGELSPPRSPDVDVVLVIRSDVEGVRSRAIRLPPTVSTVTSDWTLGTSRHAIWQALLIPGLIARKLGPAERPLYPVVRRAYDLKAALNFSAAVNLLSRGRVVVTDRLHAALLAVMLGKPVVALDSVNGKVHHVIRSTFTSPVNVQLAKDEAEAESLTTDVLSSFR